MKKKSIVVITLICIVCACIAYIVVNNIYFSKLGKTTSLKSFEPFSKNNILKESECSLKLSQNLPKIEGASAFYPFSANLVQAMYEESSYSKGLVKMVSTSQAYKDVINGKTDIVITTGPSDEQSEWIKDTLEFKELYLEHLVIFVNNESNIENFSVEQIKDIYTDINRNWNTYQLEKNNGSQTCFESIVKDNKLGKYHYEVNTMPKIIDKVALDKNGIGYAFYSYYSKMYVNENTKKIMVNGKEAEDKDYPLQFKVYLVYRKDNTNENISKIVEYLQTEEGMNLINNIK